MVEQRPQAPHTERRVRLVGRSQEVERLVRARVQHSHHDTPLGERLEHLPVRRDLLLLRRRLLAVVQEEELGTEETDALGTGVHGGLHVRRTTDVRQQRHLVTVRRGTGPGRGRQRGPARGGRSLELSLLVLTRVHEDLTRAAVDGDHRAFGELTGTRQRHHSRHPERTRQNRAVARRTALLGNEAEHESRVQQCGVGRREITGN